MEDYTRLWVRLIWYVQSCSMRIFKWTPKFHPSKESPLTPIWVHFHLLPLYLFEGEGLLSVANSIGRPLRIDSHNVDRVKLGTASVCVELDVSKPLMNETWVSFADDKDHSIVDGFGQKVKYDDVPPIVQSVFIWAIRTTIKKGVMNHVPNNNGASTSGTKDSDEVAHAPAVTPYIPRGNAIEKWIKKLYTKSNVTKMTAKEVVPTTNSFAGLESIDIVEKEEDGEMREDSSEALRESPHGPILNGPETSSHGSMMIAGKLIVTNLDGFQAISKDFQEDMGAFCKEFSTPSTSSSPRSTYVSSLVREDGALGLLMAEADIEGQLADELQQVYKDSLEDVGVDISSPDASNTTLSHLEKDLVASDDSRPVVITEKAGKSSIHVE
ncbi:hypothetical protein LIER_35249 [Lithospermum erythrorhizon]|uniref:DUF4283 domain-containing protein n=1 Tax=Lithospermum erythrorhizon TaxID=34254 RepID=A0AAV3NME7_LITER